MICLGLLPWLSSFILLVATLASGSEKGDAPIAQQNTSSTNAAVDPVQVDIAGIVLAQIGSEWGRTLLL